MKQKYWCAFRGAGDGLKRPDPEAQERLRRECRQYEERLARSGRLVLAAALEPCTMTVRLRSGELRVEPGAVPPEALLEGFCLIEAADLNDAIRLAAHMPAARFGSIEVRPVRRR